MILFSFYKNYIYLEHNNEKHAFSEVFSFVNDFIDKEKWAVAEWKIVQGVILVKDIKEIK